jgi:hypothetical protein
MTQGGHSATRLIWIKAKVAEFLYFLNKMRSQYGLIGLPASRCAWAPRVVELWQDWNLSDKELAQHGQ